MNSQQQPIAVDTLSASPQTGVWAAGSVVAISTKQKWKKGDTVFAAIANISSRTVASVANTGQNLGTWVEVTDGTTPASTASTTALELEVWSALASDDGEGIVTATLSGAGAAGTEIMTFALYGTQVAADAVAVANTAAAVVALPAATSIFGDAQALTIFATKGANNTPAAQVGYSLLGNVSSSSVLISATLAAAFTPTVGTVVTPPVTAATQSVGSPSCAITILLRPIVPPPTGLTATYTAGVGVTLAWTPPAGYTGTGFNVYKTTAASQNGVPHRLDPNPLQPIPWGTNGYVDRAVGFTPVIVGANIGTYYVTTVDGALESPASVTATASFIG